MGEVYRAVDTRLGRPVALKVLPDSVSADTQRMHRFVQEARAASALSHPNVAHIYEIGQSDSLTFIAMEFVEGQRLDARAGTGPLPVPEIIDIGLQLADALDEAHGHHIVHRDIKPANVLLTARGQVKLLDFGLAKTASCPAADIDTTTGSMTDPGVVAGTVRYMSPEQALGHAVGPQSDIFSVGVLLYELATGRLPFDGGSATEVVDRIVHAQPDSVARFNYRVPAELERIIRKCLEKAPDRRYQSARDLEIDLRNLKRDSDSGVTAPSADVSRRRAGTLALVAVAVALLAVGTLTAGYWLRSRQAALDSIVVLPFVNVTHDPNVDYLADGIAESLINSLSQIQGVRVVPRGVAFRYRGRDSDPAGVAEELGVRAVLTGRVTLRGDVLNVQAELTDARRLSQLWGEQFDRRLADLAPIQRQITEQISARLMPRLSGEERRRLAKRDPRSSEAYQAYLLGRYYWERRSEEGLRKSLGYFEKAIAADPTYALGYAGLADAYSLLGRYDFAPARDVYPKSKAAAARALELDETLVEAIVSLAYVSATYDWNWSQAETSFRRAIALNPNYATAHHWYGLLLDSQARFDQALVELRRAQELEPLSVIISTNLGRTYMYLGELDQAVEWHRRAQELDPGSGEVHLRLGWTYERMRRYPEALNEYRQAVERRAGGSLGALGHLFGVTGRRSEALGVLARLENMANSGLALPYDVALVYLGLGDMSETFRWLRRACEERQSMLSYARVDPLLNAARGDPRFAEVLTCIGLPAH